MQSGFVVDFFSTADVACSSLQSGRTCKDFKFAAVAAACSSLQSILVAGLACSSLQSGSIIEIFIFQHSNLDFFICFYFLPSICGYMCKANSTFPQACSIFLTSKHTKCRCGQLVPLAHQARFPLSRFYET